MRAVLHYRASPALVQSLRAAAPPWLTITSVDEADQARVLAEFARADILLHVLTPVTAALMDAAPRLKLIQKIGVGVNTIDRVAAKARGIKVANMPGTNSPAVSEMTLALMLAALRKIVPFDRATRAGLGWSLPLDAVDAVSEIHGKTVGLIGYGAVPQRLAPVLKALGARVVYCTRATPGGENADHLELDELLALADIVSLHVPLTEDTHQLLGAAEFAAMKPGVVLINTARGALVSEPALLQALQCGQVRAAGLDVLALEPATAGNPLFDLPNVVVTPHLAWLTPETLARSFRVAIENCRRIRAGEPLLYEIPL